MSTKLYPDPADQRRSTIIGDVAVVVCVVVFAALGYWVHERVADIGVVAEGVTDAGTSLQGGFDSAADAVGGIPVVGDRLADAFSSSGSATGGNVASLGRQGEDAVRSAARLAGALTFALPTMVLLGLTVPARRRQIRRMTVASRLFAGAQDERRRRLLAMRAAFGLPMDQLLAHCDDPIGDLIDGHHERLLAALFDDAGLAVPAPQEPARI